MSYTHKEAFCLMKYRSDDGTEEEMIWNSRDGVTPFVITLRSGKQAVHVEWKNDLCVPEFIPAPGTRIFADLTEERATEFARDSLIRHPRRGVTIKELVKEYMRPGAPDLIEVTGETED